MEQFNRPNTRSQDSGINKDIENMRHQDISFSEPAPISPVTVASADLQTASPLQVAAESPVGTATHE